MMMIVAGLPQVEDCAMESEELEDVGEQELV